MSNNSSAEELRALLQSVETDLDRTSPNREQIRRSVLAAFDDASQEDAKREPEVISLISSVDREHGDVVSIVVTNDEPSRSIWSPRLIGLAAVAAAIILIAGFLIPNDRDEIETTGPTTSESGTPSPANTGIPAGTRLAVDDREKPALLLPGYQTTANIAGGLSFDAPAGLVVVSEDSGQLVFAVADGPTDAGLLIIIETKLTDWEAELAALTEAGAVNIKQLRVMVDGQPASRLDARLTNEAVAARSCALGEPCIRLDGWPATGPAALWAGADNRVIEIGRTEDTLVLAIETSQRFNGPLSQPAAQVVSTAALSPE